MKQNQTVKTWLRTKVQNLVRHRSSRYYARVFSNGKERWKALGTTALEGAKSRLRELLKAGSERAPIPRESNAGRMIMAGPMRLC